MKHYFKKIWHWMSHPIQAQHKRKEMRRLQVNDKTEIVIEGFPRSANTFAVVAFSQAQNREVIIAHHHHRVEQIIQAVEREIPVCVLIRDPVDATKSLVLRNSGDINDRLARYIEFYGKAWPMRESFVIAPFDQVTRDFGKIVEKINEKFRTDFSVFQHTEENSQKVFQALYNLNSRRNQGNYQRSSAPDSRRTEILANMDVVLDDRLLDKAKVLYKQYMSAANEPLVHDSYS